MFSGRMFVRFSLQYQFIGIISGAVGVSSAEIPPEAVPVFDYFATFPFDAGKTFAVSEISTAEPVDYKEYDHCSDYSQDSKQDVVNIYINLFFFLSGFGSCTCVIVTFGNCSSG